MDRLGYTLLVHVGIGLNGRAQTGEKRVEICLGDRPAEEAEKKQQDKRKQGIEEKAQATSCALLQRVKSMPSQLSTQISALKRPKPIFGEPGLDGSRRAT